MSFVERSNSVVPDLENGETYSTASYILSSDSFVNT
jgi:hypothetical protein